jgi:hypothetical protein
MAVNLGIVPSQKSTSREFRARLVLGNASVDRTDQILEGGTAFWKFRSESFGSRLCSEWQ